jgi:hypothetical protein
MLSLLPLLLSATLTPAVPPAAPSAFALLDSPYRHVRTTDKYVQALLRMGLQRSPTFASLMAQLNETDVIVYLEPVRTLPTTLSGRLLLLPHETSQRYLRIQVLATLGPMEIISLIGHELRHALEVAQAPHIRTPQRFVAYYRAHGGETGRGTFDTVAARRTEWQVREELLRSSDEECMVPRAAAATNH